MKTLAEHESINDARLVELCLTGNRDAFAQVVARYQSLICGIAYSACGDVGRSEDLAQDTFITAWKNLRALNEPVKLKSWLCGIARNLINNSLRRELRTPTSQSDPLQQEVHSDGENPHEQAMSKEEEALVWRALETIPPDYREPMVLFYREGQSTQAVAAALDLSEEAVRQRLSRGRVMLNERVTKTVESALFKSAPGKVFTLGVLAALPAFAISAKAATLGATALKGSTAAKVASCGGIFGALLTPFISFFGMWVGYRITQESARSDREREFNKSCYKRLIGCIGGFFVSFFLLMCCSGPLLKTSRALFVSLIIAIVLAYLIAVTYYSIWCYRMRKKFLADLTPEEKATNPTQAVWEFRSRFELLGLPFIHLRMGDRMGEPLKAWIAIGDCALGILFAFGGCAIAPVSIGGCAVGLISFGGVSLGALALGGMGLGIWSFGGLAVGWQAFGGCAVAWNAAWGGYAIAHYFALGGAAYALQTNSEAIHQLLILNPFFRISEKVLPYLFWMNFIWIIPMIVQRQVVARKAKRLAAATSSNFL